jgi:uncharacterized protein (TIGR02217 family)
MTGFHDVLFPADISRGCRGGPSWSTRLNVTGSGYEYRNAEWSNLRGKWNVGFGVRTDDDLDTLIAFFNARQGRAYSFRFRDPLDHRVTLQALQTNPATGLVQTAKLYVSGGVTYTRFITLPVSGSVTGLGGGASVNYTTGVVSGASEGTVVSFLYDCKARFDTDHLDGQAIRDGLASFDDIPVVEVR